MDFPQTAEFVARYDAMILGEGMRRFYGGRYYNVGDWQEAATLAQACAALVRRVAAPAQAPGFVQPGDAVLDVGCGLGASSAELAHLFPHARVTGVNLSPAQVCSAQAAYPALGFCAMDATRLALAGTSVRCIVSVEAAFHFQPRTAFFNEAFRVLQPGGLLLLSDMLFHSEHHCPWWVPPQNARDGWTSYRTACESAGFEIDTLTDATATTLHPFCQHLDAEHPGAGLGEALAAEVRAYVVVALRKPAPGRRLI